MPKLTTDLIETLGNGVHGDGGGLYYRKRGNGQVWQFRYTWQGSEHTMSLGWCDLDTARARAADLRDRVAAGQDPRTSRQQVGPAIPAPSLADLKRLRPALVTLLQWIDAQGQAVPVVPTEATHVTPAPSPIVAEAPAVEAKPARGTPAYWRAAGYITAAEAAHSYRTDPDDLALLPNNQAKIRAVRAGGTLWIHAADLVWQIKAVATEAQQVAAAQVVAEIALVEAPPTTKSKPPKQRQLDDTKAGMTARGFIPLADARRNYSLSDDTIRRLVDTGTVKRITRGRRVWLFREHLDRWAANNTIEAAR